MDADWFADRLFAGLEGRMMLPPFLRKELRAFVRDVVREAVAWEREECARAVERVADEYRWAVPGTDGEVIARTLAEAIRARR